MSVHLHVRSCYTLLQSTLTISKIVAAAKRCGYTAVALTDKHVMHGAMAFYHACKKEHITPIFGMEVDVLEQEELYGFVVLAKNDAGYQNLLKLSTWLNTGFGYARLLCKGLHCFDKRRSESDGNSYRKGRAGSSVPLAEAVQEAVCRFLCIHSTQ